MSSKRLAIIVILIMAFMLNCSGDYGKIRRQTSADNKMTIAELRESLKDYHIYYSKAGGTTPKNIMFDPKDDETRLRPVGDAWYKIADQQTLSEIINVIESVRANREVMIVEGPNRRFFGYIYCSWTEWGNPIVRGDFGKIVDEHTLDVSANL